MIYPSGSRLLRVSCFLSPPDRDGVVGYEIVCLWISLWTTQRGRPARGESSARWSAGLLQGERCTFLGLPRMVLACGIVTESRRPEAILLHPMCRLSQTRELLLFSPSRFAQSGSCLQLVSEIKTVKTGVPHRLPRNYRVCSRFTGGRLRAV